MAIIGTHPLFYRKIPVQWQKQQRFKILFEYTIFYYINLHHFKTVTIRYEIDRNNRNILLAGAARRARQTWRKSYDCVNCRLTNQSAFRAWLRRGTWLSRTVHLFTLLSLGFEYTLGFKKSPS